MSELGKALAPEDVCVGDKVTVLHGVRLHDARVSEDGSISTVVMAIEDNSWKGDVLVVKAICIPYVVADNESRQVYGKLTLDLRRVTLMRLPEEYVKAAKP